MKSRSPCDTST